MQRFFYKMKRLNIYVVKQLIAPLFATFFIIIFVLLMQFIWMFVDDLVGKGLPTSVVLEFFYYAFLRLILQALPLTILLSSIMTFGNLGESLELLSMKAAGISLLKIMRPMIILVALMSVGAFFFANDVEPLATKKLATLRYDIGRKNPEMNLKEKVFNYDLSGLAIKIDRKNQETNMLYGLMMYDHTDNEGNTNVTIADSGYIGTAPGQEALSLTLYSGRTFSNLKESNKRYDNNNVPYRRDTFSMQVMVFATKDELKRSDANIYGRIWFAKRLPELRASSDSLKKTFKQELFVAERSLIDNEYKMTVQIGKDKDFDEISDTLKSVSCDSIFKTKGIQDQARIVEIAISFAKNIQQKIDQRTKVHEASWYVIRKHEAEMHKRYTGPLSCLIFFFIGAPLGAIIRKGGFGMPVIISIFLYIIWYIINTFGTKMATEGISTVWVGMWLSSFILTVTGGFLTYQAATDSVIMNTDNYLRIFKKFAFVVTIFNRIRKK